MTHILVTGGAGFIGSHTVDLLMSQGHRVTVFDDLSAGSLANLSRWQDDPKFTFVKGDVSGDFAATIGAAVAETGPIDRIIHYAAQTAVPMSIEDPVKDIRVNVAGSVQVLEYARRNKIAKVAFASSSAVYDDAAPVPVSEKTLARPSSPYGIDKRVIEYYLDYYDRIFGLKYTALRFMNVYGPRQDPKSYYSGVISIFLDRAVKKTDITIFDDGEQTRDFVYVTDVAAAVVKACLDDGAHGEIINIGTGVEVTINTLAKTILDLAGSTSAIGYAPARKGDIRRSVTTMDKATRLLSFKPAMNLRDGLAQTLAWVRTQA
jgi:UDP-glucose 4-epimerase